MAQRIEDAPITVRDGALVGGLRRPVNQAQDVDGSIHQDETAEKLGFRGGTVAGSIHLELFPPLCLAAFGQRWFERGSLSINFRNATTDQEPVRASLEQPSEHGAEDGTDVQVAARIEREDGLLVGEGTAAVGSPSDVPALQALDLHRYERGELKILSDVRDGDVIEPKRIGFTGGRQRERLDVITDVLDWYDSDSPWGGPVASPATMVELLYAHPAAVIGAKAAGAVPLFGAIEVAHVDGPVLLDATYDVGATIAATGQSPKTEYVWFDAHATTPEGRRVATMRMQLRWMKASSDLYEE